MAKEVKIYANQILITKVMVKDAEDAEHLIDVIEKAVHEASERPEPKTVRDESNDIIKFKSLDDLMNYLRTKGFYEDPPEDYEEEEEEEEEDYDDDSEEKDEEIRRLIDEILEKIEVDISKPKPKKPKATK